MMQRSDNLLNEKKCSIKDENSKNKINIVHENAEEQFSFSNQHEIISFQQMTIKKELDFEHGTVVGNLDDGGNSNNQFIHNGNDILSILQTYLTDEDRYENINKTKQNKTKQNKINPNQEKTKKGGSILHLKDSENQNDAPISSGSKTYKCTLCHEKFQNFRALLAHSRTHPTSEKPFNCKICHKTFTRKNKFKVHSLKHVQSTNICEKTTSDDFKCSVKDCTKKKISKKHNNNQKKKSELNSSLLNGLKNISSSSTKTNCASIDNNENEKPFKIGNKEVNNHEKYPSDEISGTYSQLTKKKFYYRKNMALKIEDIRILEDFFQIAQYPSSEEKTMLCKKIGCKLNKINQWFKNKRYRHKMLNRYNSESNSSINRQIQNEVVEEKILNTSKEVINTIDAADIDDFCDSISSIQSDLLLDDEIHDVPFIDLSINELQKYGVQLNSPCFVKLKRLKINDNSMTNNFEDTNVEENNFYLINNKNYQNNFIQTTNDNICHIKCETECQLNNSNSNFDDVLETDCNLFKETSLQIKEEPKILIEEWNGQLLDNVSLFKNVQAHEDFNYSSNDENYPFENDYDYNERLKELYSRNNIKSARNFTCDTCKSNFNNYENFSKHLCTNTKKESLLEVKQITSSKIIIKKQKDDISSINCEVCFKKFLNIRNLRFHRRIVHKKESIYECDICGEFCESRGIYNKHMQIHPREEIYRCQLCFRKFGIKPNVTRHIRLIHGTERPYVCSVQSCKFQFKNLERLRIHFKQHANDNLFQCSIKGCEVYFNDAKSLQLHSHIHDSDRPHVCQICSKSFKHNINLILHKSIHNKVDTKCRFCGKIFSNKANLKRHILIHTGEKPFECSFCHKRFNQRSSLTSHMMSFHINNKSEIPKQNLKRKSAKNAEKTDSAKNVYKSRKCPICKKKVQSIWYMSRHMRIHTGEKPYKCPMMGCNKSFAMTSNLNSHIRTHMGEKSFICPVENCQQSFLHSSSLRLHCRRRHNLNTPYKCIENSCNRYFSKLKSFKNHKKTAHSLESCIEEGSFNKTEIPSDNDDDYEHVNEGNNFENEVESHVCPVKTCMHKCQTLTDLLCHLRDHNEGNSSCEEDKSNRIYTIKQNAHNQVPVKTKSKKSLKNIRKIKRMYKCLMKNYGKNFLHSILFKKYYRIYLSHRRYPCPYKGCGNRFTFAKTLNVHKKIHSMKKILNTKNCIQDMCSEIDNKICYPNTFNKLISYLLNINKTKRNFVRTKGRKNPEKRKIKLLKNENLIKLPNEESQITIDKKLNSPYINVPDKKYFTKLNNLKCNSNRIYKCKINECNKKFTRLSAFKIHKRLQHIYHRTYKCKFKNCTKRFTFINLLKFHYEQKHKLNKCKFKGCNKNFTALKNLKSHSKVHNDENAIGQCLSKEEFKENSTRSKDNSDENAKEIPITDNDDNNCK